MKRYSSGELPISTSNAALAFALYLAGTPFADDKSPTVNIYDPDILRALGYAGMDIDQAVAGAMAKHQKGHVEYSFTRSWTFGLAQKAYAFHQKAVEASPSSAAVLVSEIHQKLTAGRVSQAEAMSGAVCIILKRWRTELESWQTKRAYGIQANRNDTGKYDALELAAKVFLSGDFHAFAAVVMDARREFLKLHFRYPPIIRIHKSGKSRQDGERVKMPGFVLFSDNADSGTRKALGVPRK